LKPDFELNTSNTPTTTNSPGTDFNHTQPYTMSTLLDRLLEVAKDFEAERLQDQLTSQRRERQLEADLKALKRTALYRADEIAFLENQLQDVRSEVEAANEALKEAQDHNLKQSSTIETDMKREIVCLRLEIGRLKNINSKLSEKVDDDEKENSGVLRIGQPKNELSSLDLEIQEEPVLLSRESIDMQDTASSFYMAAENGDVAAMEELLSPACVCIDSYEQLITRALSSVCAAAVNHGEGHVDEEDAAERRLNMAKLLIAEGAATTTTVVKESVSASGSGTNAVKKNKATEEYVSPAPLHMAAWSGDAALVELLLAQPNPPLNVPCVSGTTNLSGGLNVSQEEDPESGSVIISSTTFKGTPLQLAVGTTLGAASTVAKALLMAGADPDQVLAEDAMGDSGGGVTLNADMKSIFDDCTVMFWNSSVRAFEAYSSSNYDKALKIWGEALKYIQQGKLPISGADKARLHYNRVCVWCCWWVCAWWCGVALVFCSSFFFVCTLFLLLFVCVCVHQTPTRHEPCVIFGNGSMLWRNWNWLWICLPRIPMLVSCKRNLILNCIRLPNV
jgi:hypothetical protein